MIIYQGKLRNYIFEQKKNYVVVVSPKGQFYLIPIGSGIPIRCSCKGYTYNQKCKHFDFAMELDLPTNPEQIDNELIGPWTGLLYEYALAYSSAPSKEDWYGSNRIPNP